MVISNDGVVLFPPSKTYYPHVTYLLPNNPVSVKYIAPFWCESAYTTVGEVYYRAEYGSSTAGDILDTELSSIFGITFQSNVRIVATWDRIGYFDAGKISDEGTDKLNTFQVVISADDSGNTFACFFYADNGINWSQSIRYYGSPAVFGPNAIVGFSDGDSVHYYIYPTSGTDEILNIDNVVTLFGTGNLCYKVDSINITTVKCKSTPSNSPCPGAFNLIDNNNDQTPDCVDPPVIYELVYDGWKCGANSVFFCDSKSGISHCEYYSSVLNEFFNVKKGIYLGPCDPMCYN